MRLSLCGLFLWGGLTGAALFPPASVAQTNEIESKLSQNASPQESDFLIVTGDWDTISGQSEGGGGSFEWLHSTRPGRIVNLGMATYGVGDSHWTLGRGGASFWFAERWTIDAQVSLGGGSATGSSFVYQQYQAKLMYQASSRLYIKAQEEYLDIGNSRGHLVRAGTYFLPSRLISADLSYARSIGGNLGTQFFSSRFDLSSRALRPFAGFAVGQAAPEVFDVGVGQVLGAQDLREGFGGVVFPISKVELTVAMDWIQVGNTKRIILTAGLKLPLGKISRLHLKP